MRRNNDERHLPRTRVVYSEHYVGRYVSLQHDEMRGYCALFLHSLVFVVGFDMLQDRLLQRSHQGDDGSQEVRSMRALCFVHFDPYALVCTLRFLV